MNIFELTNNLIKYSDPMKNLKKELSDEWQKPKEKNAKGKEARDYNKIHSIQDEINSNKLFTRVSILMAKETSSSLKTTINKREQSKRNARDKKLKEVAAKKLKSKREKQIKLSK